AVGDHQCAAVVDAAAEVRGVVVDGAVGQLQRAHVGDAATVVGKSVAKSQATDRRGDTAADREDAVVSGGVGGAADVEHVRPRAGDGDVAAQVRQRPGQVDSAGDAEGDGVGPRIGVGQLDGLAQGQVADGVIAVVLVVGDVHRQRELVSPDVCGADAGKPAL